VSLTVKVAVFVLSEVGVYMTNTRQIKKAVVTVPTEQVLAV
jgi:hypothetical protein